MTVSVGMFGGVTVVLFSSVTGAAVDFRGAVLGTRETDLLGPENLVQRIDALCFSSGGSAGLAAADGVVRWLSERGLGFPVGASPHEVVPIVPAVTVASGAPGTAEDGYAACEAARELAVQDEVWALAVGSTGVVVVDAVLAKSECKRLTVSAQDGLIRATGSGGTVFAVATGPRELPSEVMPRAVALNGLCTEAARVFEVSISTDGRAPSST
ncbi:P1 family peptidase [Amycolatopsis sp. NPDC059657]|uniref:P1 family peptidase n=1 Tax=Amycolatopsis sp. NPDC059657 TaxID=3346899 RepID=UPI0036730118